MKFFYHLFFIWLCLLNCTTSVFAAMDEPQLSSDYAVLMDAETGQVLYQKQMQELAYPASTTKIMTALLVCELGNLDDQWTVSESAVDIDEWNSTNIGLIPGEQLGVDDLMYALMLHSANDAANALAEYVAGSQERFVEMMNQRAWQMGLSRTCFSNAHGLHHPMHSTTAHDLAIITQYAIQNEDFMRYFGASTHTIPPTNLSPIPRTITNHQAMLIKETSEFRPDILGGKVGFTNAAQHTMSTVASVQGRTLICVVMHSTERSQKFQDTNLLLDYAEIALPELLTTDSPTIKTQTMLPLEKDTFTLTTLHILIIILSLTLILLSIVCIRYIQQRKHR